MIMKSLLDVPTPHCGRRYGRMRPQHVCAKMATVLFGKLYVKTFKKLYVHCDGLVVFYRVKKVSNVTLRLIFQIILLFYYDDRVTIAGTKISHM